MIQELRFETVPLAINRKVESGAEFNTRLDAEEREARAVACPLVDRCGAQVGEPCCTEAGEPRIRHCRRLWLARKAGK
jgi:hypothetical protein